MLPEIKLLRSDNQKIHFPDIGETLVTVIGNRNKIGGIPDWIQEDETPVCPSCGELMTFYGQLDSIDPEHAIDDCGMIYVFICLHCSKSTTILQSY